MSTEKEYRILHIEDSPIDVDLVLRVLKKAGLNFRHHVVDNKDGLLQAFDSFDPNVILCDHSLPQFDSFMAFEIYKEKNPDIAFILVTGSVSEEYAVEMMRKGIDDYLLKENLQRLPTAIENAFTKREKEKLRRLAEMKLANSEMLLNKAQQLARIGSIERNLITGKETWSNEIFRILGLAPDEIEASPEELLNFIHPDDHGFVTNNIERGQTELRDMSFYNRIVRKDGKVRHVHFESKFELDKNQNPVRLIGILQDITEKVLADAEKEFDRKNLSALINNTNDLIWSVDKDFKLISSNQAFEQVMHVITRRPVKKGTNVLFESGFEKELVLRWKEHYERAFKGEIFKIVEFYQEAWSEISFYPIRKGITVIGTACYSHDITERKKSEQEILNKNEQLKDLTSHLQNIREEERTTISREIHDELGQQLTALKMDIDWVKHKHNGSDPKVGSKLQEMLKMSDNVINTVRRISADLRPAIIDDLGLIAALEWKCHDFEEKTGVGCKFLSTVKERKFENHFGINAYRILQETLTNVSRHSKATSVTVSVHESDEELFMEITDNGVGIDKDRVKNGKTLGIVGMKERAALLGGKLSIEGAPGKGTNTRVTLPLKNEYINS